MMEQQKNKVEVFIDNIKSSFPEVLEHVFYRGYCYWFAFILAERFKGEIWFNPKTVHFAAYIHDDLYDIFGKVMPGYDPYTGEFDENAVKWMSWVEFQYNNQEAVESIVNTCIKKEG